MKRILLRLCFLSSALAIIAMPMSAAEKPMNVVFILADDLGWSDTELYGHTKLYNTPNILRLAELLDIYPTLVDLADLPEVDHLEGLSLSRQLTNASAPRKRPAITSHNQGNYSIVNEKWRYIRYVDGAEELYDIVNDPHEWTNIAEKRPEVLKTDKWGRTLLFSVDEWRKELFAPTVPRSARVQYEGARYHIINRGNYRKDLFRTHKTDRAFTEVMLEACEHYQWSLHAYVLMSNHYHLCVETPQANLSDGMHWLQSTFANKFSRFSGERGHVFQGRYQSLIIEGDYGILNVVDYIHLNPVRAGVITVDRLKAYTNSSFPKYFTKYRHPNLRCEDFLHEAGGLSPSPGGMRSYHKRLKLIMEDSPQEREKLFKDLSRGWYIGTKQGKDQLRAKVEQGIAKASVEAKRELEHIRIEKLIKLCLKQLHKNQKDIEEAKKSAQWKIAIASHMKANTGIKNPQLSWISHKIRSERTKVECWCGFRADARVKLGRHPAKSRI